MKPTQRCSSQRAFHVVAFGKRFQAHLAKTRSQERVPDAQRLRGGRDLVALTANDENLCAEKAGPGTKFSVALAEQIFVDPGEVKASDAVALYGEQGSDEAGALGATGDAGARYGPFVRSGKTAMEGGESGEGHGGAPAGAVVPGPLGSIGGEDEPAFAQRLPDIEMDIAAVLALKIARRKNDQDRPDLSRIETRRHGQDRDRVGRGLIAADRREGSLFGAERHGNRDRLAWLDWDALKCGFGGRRIRWQGEEQEPQERRDEGRTRSNQHKRLGHGAMEWNSENVQSVARVDRALRRG